MTKCQINSRPNSRPTTPPQRYRFESALIETPGGTTEWRRNVVLSIADGVITEIEHSDSPSDAPLQDGVTAIDGVALPAIANIHSHAFQRGFAGLSEYRTAANDSFWTWRKLMYDFVLRLSPEDVYVIARQLYLEMLMGGYSWVGEFHYLHNAESGAAYPNHSEMSEAILQAANDTGIAICLLPVLYQRSGFDSSSTTPEQRRFSLTDDAYFNLLDRCNELTTGCSNATVGMAFHSLRAVSSESINSAIAYGNAHLPGCPIHIHVAEQTKEVDDCVAVTGRRPVEFLLSQFDVDSNWCLIHATHMTPDEIASLAKTGATAGLCPTTEANLGDGFFPAQRFLDSNGHIAIGSDSHCSLDFRDELRTLEYGQRLLHRQRAILGTETESVGRRLFYETAASGGRAIQIQTGKIAIGYRADLIIIDNQHPTISGASEDRLLDRLIFSNTGGNPIRARMINGTWINDDHISAQMETSRIEFADLNRRLLE